MGNNPSRPHGPTSRSRFPHDQGFPKRSYTTRGGRGKYDRYEFDDDDHDGGYPPPHAYGAFPGMAGSALSGLSGMSGMAAMPPPGYVPHQQYMAAPGQPLFPQPQMQPGVNPVIPHMPMHGAMPTAGNPFPAGPMNMPMPEPAFAGAGGPGSEAPVIPPLPTSHRGRTGTPYHPPNRMYDSPDSDEYTDRLDEETRARLQPPLAPGQYGPHDRARDPRHTPAPALRQRGHGHRRVESSPMFGRSPSPPFDGDRVIPQNLAGGPPFPGFVPFEMGGMGGMGGGGGMPQPEPEPEPIRPRRFEPMPRRDNPLPPPPRDIMHSSPYAKIIRELRKPIDTHAIMASAPAIHTVGAINIPAPVQPQNFGSRAGKEKKRRGLFSSLRRGSRRPEEDEGDVPHSAPAGQTTFVGGQSTAVYPIVHHMPDGSTQLIYNPPGVPGIVPAPVAGVVPPPGAMPGYVPAGAGGVNPPPPVIPGRTTPVIPPGANYPPAPASTPVHNAFAGMQSPGPGRSRTPQPQPHPPSPIPNPPPPQIRIERDGELRDLLHFSPHRVHYNYRSWPTGMHLFEAFRFPPERGDLTEEIRRCGTAEEAGAIADGRRGEWRSDWERVALEKMEEVLYHKMVQHPDLRALLMQTGIADLVFSDPDTTWGDGQIGQGRNWLGIALMNVRRRLRVEGLDS